MEQADSKKKLQDVEVDFDQDGVLVGIEILA
jgi:uncharacterized protein YuzE